jgi:VWFA-related protein
MVTLLLRTYRLFSASLTLALFAGSQFGNPLAAAAQTSAIAQLPSAPAPTQPPAADSTTPKYVIQTQVPLVVLDVVVNDASGHPVRGLTAADFTLLEGGQPMTPKSFEEHRADQAPPVQATPVNLDLGTNVFTNFTSAPNNGPLNVLLLDALNTPVADQMVVRQQMFDYLKNLPSGTHMAVFGLTSHLLMLQGFTTDPALLKAILSGKTNLPTPSSLLIRQQDVDSNQAVLDQISEIGTDGMVADMQQFQSYTGTDQTSIRIQDTLAAMNVLARYLSGLPGRKNLIWFSGSFPFNIMPDSSTENPFGAAANFSDDVQATADLMARAQVAVYPIDARGLFSNPALGPATGGTNQKKSGLPPSMSDAKFFIQTTDDHGTMQMMADQTGGKAFINTNGLKDAAQQAIDNGSNYYTLTYTPTNLKLDGSYRKVHVNIDRPGLQLFYRHGYYADDPNTAPQGQKVLPVSAMQTAMMRGGPGPAQILFKAQIIPSPATEANVSVGSKANLKLMNPPYRHLAIHYAADVRDFAFGVTPDGVYHGSIEYAAVLYNSDGAVLNVTSNVIRPDFPEATYQVMLKNTLRLHLDLEVPVSGDYFLRIGIHDLASDRVGAVEVPLSSIKLGSAPTQLQSAPAAAK